MPPEGIQWKPHDNILTFEQIIRIVGIMAGLGIRKIRLTGGEPLLRRGISALLNEIKSISGIEKVTLTTNGLLLGAYLDEAEKTGCAMPDGINISLDALDSERYRQLTRRSHADVKEILLLVNRLLEKNISVKINCVPIRSFNEDEILPIVSLAKEKNITVRFIELMSFGVAASFQTVPGCEAAAQIEKVYGRLTPIAPVDGSGPAVYYSITGFAGKVGFINPVTKGFCSTCNRLRLTPEGFLKLCLSSDLGIDLRKPLRDGAGDNGLAKMICETITHKPKFHTFSAKHHEGMSKIGG
jgi:cyclic pyranopterin phosphate synthase